MSGFSAKWLALRADADMRARNPVLAWRLRAHFTGRRGVRILDLGSGTGANMRTVAPMLDAGQHWILADHDAGLLDLAMSPAGVTVERRVVDLATDLHLLFDPAPDLVTASALLDLGSAGWIERLCELVVGSGAALYTVLSYTGREEWEPPHPFDAEILAVFHADQRRDKGLGAALGPLAHAHLSASLRAGGYEVRDAASDWVLEQPRDAGLIAALAAGSAAAVAQSVGEDRANEWRAAREFAARVVIAHGDLLGLPPG